MKNIWNGTNLEKVIKLSFKSNTIFNIYIYILPHFEDNCLLLIHFAS